MSREDRDRRNLERQLARQTITHHLRREEELERLLADAMTLSRGSCKCRTCKSLRHLADELEGSHR